ncbi:PAS domain-containing sensor histidine kinase [Desulfopila sp. IMCC35008]|uniref:sensor histidine kinase n=1 Tax=Desulfopila sp. IMCC35008 TaxID=2653858 RepID=UPI0013D48D65|nr:ATP-binding protein [Desulfopila sp. IMCC35008]
MRKHLVNVSPWILAAACTLLAVIIGSFAINNYNREKRLMEAALLQKGESVLRFIDSGMKVSFRGYMMGIDARQYRFAEHIQDVISQALEDEDVHFIELIDGQGVVRAAGGSRNLGEKIGADYLSFIQAGQPGKPHARMYYDSNGERVGYQVSMTYEPRPFRNNIHHGMRGRGMGNSQFRDRIDENKLQEELDRWRGKQFSLVVELDLEKYDKAVQRQVVQIAILSVVLLLVGVGGWLSLLTLQGLRGSQSSLQQMREFNDLLIETLPVGLIATDANGDIKMMNEAGGVILNVDPSSLLLKQPADSLPEGIGSLFGRTRSGGDVETFEKTINIGDKKKQTLLLTLLDVAGREEGPVGELLLLQDVSEIRGLETQLRRSERLAALGKMAAGVAHELRNPLSSIKGLAVVLKGRLTGDDEGRKGADVLVQETERLNRSIGELLAYARPESLEQQKVRLSAIVAETVELVRLDADQQGVGLEILSAEAEDVVFADADKLKQVFLNILLNSLQAVSAEGQICVNVGRDGSDVVCKIEDNGTGIDEENLTRVFDPYFTTKNDGTGLGLAISSKIIEEHGGSVSMESKPGCGATVTVRLPGYSPA